MFFVFFLISFANMVLCDDSLALSDSILNRGELLTVYVTRAIGQESSSDWVGITSSGNILDGNPASLLWEYVSLDTSNTGSVTFSTISLPADAEYDVYYLANDGYSILAGPETFSVRAVNSTLLPTLSTDKRAYVTGDSIIVSFNRPISDATLFDWISITRRGFLPPSVEWQYVCGGKTTCSSIVSSGQVSFPADSLSSANYDVTYFHNDGYSVVAGPYAFSVDHPGGDPTCVLASTPPSRVMHLPPTEGSELSTLTFSSCYKPFRQISPVLWQHMRNDISPDLFVWLGDNMYMDGTNIEAKRVAYNTARDDVYYSTYGPPAEPKIPVTGTWDDHDFGANNQGNEYPCLAQSQTEFVIHFNLNESDPRHPSQGASRQRGVYSAHMFSKPGGGNGVHVINLDARSGRDPTFPSYGACKGGSSQMLDDVQWAWLDAELTRPSVVKVLSSGTQVLPPTDQSRSLGSYCAYDGPGGSFETSIAAVREDATSVGTGYESWGEIPQERMRLLQKCQKAINDGFAKEIVFISGDQHWAEIMAKRMPASDVFGPSVVLHEVTASGIDQSWDETILNANRLRLRTADNQGNGVFDKECNFPFIFEGITYTDCTMVGKDSSWCAIATDSNDNYITGSWGYCLDKSLELAQDLRYSNEKTCTDQVTHVCTAQANYGAISVNWVNSTLTLQVLTPHETKAVAVVHTLHISSNSADSQQCPFATTVKSMRLAS